MSDVEIIHARAEELAQQPELFEEFDAQIVDPPYSPYVHANTTSIGTDGRGVRRNDLGFDPLSGPLRAAIALAATRVHGWSLIYTDKESTHLWREAEAMAALEYIREEAVEIEAPHEPIDLPEGRRCLWCGQMISEDTPAACPDGYVGGIPWVRWAQPQLSGDRPPSGSEACLLFWNGRWEPYARAWDSPKKNPGGKGWNGPGGLMSFRRLAMRGKDKHPTEKPLDLLLDQVSWFSNPGERVLDLCAGSGTTILACRLLDRDGSGVEADAEHAQAAAIRVAGRLSPRDENRAREWIEATIIEAKRVPEPKDESEQRTWERAQRRLADALTVQSNLKAA